MPATKLPMSSNCDGITSLTVPLSNTMIISNTPFTFGPVLNGLKLNPPKKLPDHTAGSFVCATLLSNTASLPTLPVNAASVNVRLPTMVRSTVI